MKGSVLFIILLIAHLYSCHTSNTDNAGQSDSLVHDGVPDMHTSRIALDWDGTYFGVLPCADCAGIETTLEIDYDGSFILQTVYLGENEENIFTEKGRYEWNDRGSIITLKDMQPPNQYFVGENHLIHLDVDGQRITGELSEHYVLRKQMENQHLNE